MSGKRALITGISGMVGSHLADYLLANTDWDIYGLCRWRSSLDNVKELVPLANAGRRVFSVALAVWPTFLAFGDRTLTAFGLE